MLTWIQYSSKLRFASVLLVLLHQMQIVFKLNQLIVDFTYVCIPNCVDIVLFPKRA